MEYKPGYCAHCGQPLQLGQDFCANCGTKRGETYNPNDITNQAAQPMSVQTGASFQNGAVQSTMSQGVPMQNMSAQNNMIQTSFPQGNVTPVMPVKPKKSKKKILIWSGIIAALALILIVVLVIVLNIKGQDRTIMVYMVGSDLESESAAGSLDITEMKEANFDPEHTKVLVYTGGTKKWALSEISADENAIFEVVGGEIKKVQTFEKKTMTEPSNLIDFINFAYENYPADMYDLILWDHGGGPIFGYGLDENSMSGTPMRVPTLVKALAESKFILDGKKFDFIGFDACLMGSIEVAKSLSAYSDYLIASEEVEPGNGWNYAFLNDLSEENHVKDTEELGQSIIDHYMSHYDDYAYDVDLSLSMVDLKKINKLTESTNDLFSNVKEKITTQTFSEYSRMMTRDKVYGYTGRDSESYDLVDLMDLCSSLQGDYYDKVNRIKTDFEDAVVYNRSNMENTNGLSVYFVNFNKTEAERMLVAYKDVSFSDGYYDFLTKYKDFVVGEKMVSRTAFKDLEETNRGGVIMVEIPNELKDNYQSGEIIVYRKLGENKFMPIYRSSEVELSGNKLMATSYNLQFVIEVTGDEGTEYGWSVMVEKERTYDYADYVTFGVLYYNDDSSLGFSPKSYEMHLRVPRGSNEAEVRDIRVASDNDLSSKMSFAQDKIKIIEFTAGTYKLFNEAGEQDDNMESYGQIYGTGADIEGGDTYKIKLVGLDFDFGNIYNGEFKSLTDYWAEFIVHDTQGNAHRLNLIHIDN